MKERIIEVLNQWNDMALNALIRYDEFKSNEGEAWTIPVKTGNPNVYIAFGLNGECWAALKELKDAEIIAIEPCSYMISIMDGSPIPNMPTATMRRLKGKKDCWMPMLLKKGKNFPKDLA
jgi:hypothetical protein